VCPRKQIQDIGPEAEVKKRTRDPWMAADEYGRSLPQFTVNLIVADAARSAAFYRDVLGARVLHQDEDFAAFDLAGLQFCVHADHTYEDHPWHGRLVATRERGLGAELRLLGVNPEPVEARARQKGSTILQATMEKPHGWRDVVVADPDGYAWAVGVKT
jgi:catechol 2,3-dioxygenase-like lactoylglutathione lyase family enzyme